MRIRPALKAALLAPASAAASVHAGLSAGATLALAAGAALVAFACIMLPRLRRAAVTAAPAAADACPDERPGADHRRLRTTVPRRLPRDVRCQASRATARARRSTRR
jgi:hypothetical protein